MADDEDTSTQLSGALDMTKQFRSATDALGKSITGSSRRVSFRAGVSRTRCARSASA